MHMYGGLLIKKEIGFEVKESIKEIGLKSFFNLHSGINKGCNK